MPKRSKLLWIVGLGGTAAAVLLWRRSARAQHKAIKVERNLRIPMRDGITLAADHFAPSQLQRDNAPTILIRTPYGRYWQHGWFGLMVAFVARHLARHGYHVLTQDVRGRFDSEGSFDPYFTEREDGLATLEWLKTQPWFNGQLGMWGPSYLGVVQWAIADAPEMRAMFAMITSSRLYDIVFPDGAYDMGLILRWIMLLRLGERPKYRSLLTGLRIVEDMEQRVRHAAMTLPIVEADAHLDGQPFDYIRRWLDSASPDDPIWQERLRGVEHAQVDGAVHLVGGWYDFFLRGMLNDYAALKAAGKQPQLTIGPWHHFSYMFLMWNTLGMAVDWFDRRLKNSPSASQSSADLPVRIYVMGANEWREYPDFPPVSQPRRFYLAGAQRLSDQPETSEPDHFVYDPANPTPVLGGAQFAMNAGPCDNRPLESRSDVLLYTSAVFDTPFEFIGAVWLELYAQSSREYTDFFARLCDVAPNGRSINICDGLVRVNPDVGTLCEDGTRRLEIDLWATAWHVKSGHRLRVIIAGGAHPRWSRHTGSANPLTDTILTPAQQTIFHDPQHPSALILPVVD